MSREESIAAKLRRLFEKESAPSQREVARRLAGPGATPKQIEAKRRLIQKWLDPEDSDPGPNHAQALAKIFGVNASELQALVSRRKRRQTEVAQIRAQVVALEEGVAEALQRLDALEAARGEAGGP